ncbi:hypothetical protein L7F22_039393 [Adiantum nelumboides]|nr:hypothetical protein [Adiantum nelumboides]
MVSFDVGLRGPYLLSVITACCATGFLLVGYDNGVFGGLVEAPSFNSTFNYPSENMIGNIVSLYEIGCFLGALSTFVMGEKLGRRMTIIFGAQWMIAGAIIQAAASTVGVLIFGRLVCGIGMGIINATVPVLQAETSPAFSRGKLVAIDLTVLNCGIVISYWIDYAFNFGAPSLKGDSICWRLPIALQCVFIIFIILCALVIPDTPRWLIKKGRTEEAKEVIARLLNSSTTETKVEKQFAEIKEALEHEQREADRVHGWRGLIAPGGGWSDDSLQTRKRWLLACFIQAAQQLGGINALIYYSSTLFKKSIGLSDKDSALLAGGLNMCLILGSTISIFLIDVVGRKMLLLPCIAGMSAVMVVQTGLVYKTQQPNSSKVYGRAASAMLFIFELFFSIGFQATVWLIPSEVLPLRIRTQGSALSTASNWIMNFAVVKFTPSAIKNIKYRVYIIFAVLNALWVPIIAFYLPETARKSLEEMDEAFSTIGWQQSERQEKVDVEGVDK